MRPRLLSALLRRLRGVRASRTDAEIDRELGAYVDLLTEEKIAAGVPPDEARRRALVELGGVEPVKERVRDLRPAASFDRLRRDVKYGLRLLARTPGWTAAVVVTLALGIGATAATFSVFDAVLLRPLDYAEADRLVVVMHEIDKPASPANYLDWRRLTTSFSSMAAAEYWTPNLTGAGAPEKLFALHVTADLFPTLGVEPALGRWLREGDTSHSEIVLSDRLWRRLFNGDPDVIGRDITLDGRAHAIVGIMPAGFAFAPFWATRAELWAALDLVPRGSERRAQSLRLFARLAPGSSLERAQQEVAAITARLETVFPGTNRDVTVTPLKQLVVGNVRTSIVVLFAAVGLVLLLACANVAHMLLARGAARERELAIRAALGADRRRVIVQLLTEGLLLAAAGGALGLGFAAAAIRAARVLGEGSIPRIQTVEIDGRALAFSAAVALGSVILFALVPALRSSRPNLTADLRDAERGSTVGRRTRRWRAALVASEVALAVLLVVAASLLIRSLAALRAVDPGFATDHLVSFVVAVTGTAEAAPDRRFAFYQKVAAAVSALPGVDRAAGINHVPLAGDIWGVPFAVEGRPSAASGEELSATYRVVLPGYFGVMRIPVLAGRDVTDRDRLGALPVVVVNQYLAEKYWPGGSAVGQRIRVEFGPHPEWRSIVGVVKNVVRSSWRDRPAEEVYLPLLQSESYRSGDRPHLSAFSFVVRTTADSASTVPSIRRAIQEISPAVPVSEVVVMDKIADQATLGDRFLVTLLGMFAAIGVALAAVGMYGVISFVVAGRRHEIGIRLALGATPGRLTRVIVAEGALMAVGGAAIGLAGAALARGLFAGLLFGITPVDTVSFGASALLLAIVAAVAAYLPARRASRIDPLAELKS